MLGWPEVDGVNGVEKPVEENLWSWDRWSNSQFQDQFSAEYKRNLVARPAFIRTHNQIFYSIYGESKTYVVIGKNDQLFAYNYFPAFRGFDLQTEETWKAKVDGLKRLQDSLESHGVPLLIAIAPNKVRLMPENLPDELKKVPGETTNLSRFLSLAEEAELRVFDFNAYFASRNEVDKLTRNTGTHWSAYGATLAMDTLLRLLNTSDAPWTSLRFERGFFADSLVDGDTELADHLNIWFSPPTLRATVPKIQYDTLNAVKPDVLFVADSYFWTINSLKLNHNTLSRNHSLWYYNSTNFDSRHGEIAVDSLDRWTEILRRDAVVILATESNLVDFPFGLVEDLKLNVQSE
ncbi:alginate O-acetyltransferase AlgX-related protein [Phaeocystidibacter luteus]|uniref:alginate O-acetyltransferase AlgX-related protein n=1 Tax=Phaeocystidibacter luteus TaxID=911197 RepID=UPI001478E3DF|nr:hypothetical protein [Phaeocystidibacter luteus]